MAQWRDERGREEASIQELEPVARPARVGSSRSARIPALIVGTLLVGVVAVGVSGRTEAPRDPAPRLAAATGSPAPAASSGPTPEASSPDASSSREGDLSPAPGRGPAGRGLLRSEPPPDRVPVPDDLRFWLVLLSDGDPLLRADLNASNGFYQSVRIDDSPGDDLRARLFGRLGDDQAVRLTDIPVPRLRKGSLDLPLSLAEGFIDAADLGSRDPNGLSSDLHVRIRLEQGAGHPPSAMLVVDVLTTVVIRDDPTFPGADAEEDTDADTDADADADADYDRAIASSATREALRRSSRCARMLDPRIGRSEANLEGCERALTRGGSVTASIPPAPAGATYWLDLQLAGAPAEPTALDLRPDGVYEEYFGYPESWYLRAPVLGLYGHSPQGEPVTIASVQLSRGPGGEPGLPVQLAHGPVRTGARREPLWIVTLSRGQPHGLAVLVQIVPADLSVTPRPTH